MLSAGPVLHEFAGRAYCVPSLMLAIPRRNLRDENFTAFNTTNAPNKVRFLLINGVGNVRLRLLPSWSPRPAGGRPPLCTLDRNRSMGSACGWCCGQGCLEKTDLLKPHCRPTLNGLAVFWAQRSPRSPA